MLVIDCGGGTIDDAVSYTVKALNPSLQFKQLLPGKGALIGSTSIDRLMLLWLQRVCPSGYGALSDHDKAPGSPLMNEFEKIKHDFEAFAHLNQKYRIKYTMPSESSSENYSPATREIIFTR